MSSRLGIRAFKTAAIICRSRSDCGAVGVEYYCSQAKKFSSASTPKEPSPPSENRPADYDNSKPILAIQSDEELQEEWKSLERRVSNRKLRKQDGTIQTGRSKRNSSAWDAENV